MSALSYPQQCPMWIPGLSEYVLAATTMDLPVEVILHIIYFLNPCDIVRLRQVSRQFHDMTHSSVLWRQIYANAGLLLPPGPFPSQSTRFLERTLVQSELVYKTWASQPLKMLSHTLSSWKRERRECWTVIFGRWCIFLQGKVVQCHDIDTGTYHSLYDGTALPEFWFMAGKATSVDGNQAHLLYLLLVDYNYPHELMKLLQFRVGDDSFSEPEVMDWSHIGSDSFETWQSTVDAHGSSPFLTLRRRTPSVVFDIRTRHPYGLPEPKLPSYVMNESPIPPMLPRLWRDTPWIILTKTHIIAVQMYTSPGRRSFDKFILLQALVVPGFTTTHYADEVGRLRLTHAVTMTCTAPSSFSLLRNSVVDPVTGSVNIRLLRVTSTYTSGEQRQQMSCLNLVLSSPVSTTAVLPIYTSQQQLFESKWTSERYTASDDGFARGLLLTGSGLPPSRYASARKFTIDASREACTAAVSDPSPVDLPWNEDEVAFDGTRGRFHYFQVANNVNQVVTVDLA